MSDMIGRKITVRGVRPDANYIDVELLSVDSIGLRVKDGPLEVYFPRENVQAVEIFY
jgi:hypothetical protein